MTTQTSPQKKPVRQPSGLLDLFASREAWKAFESGERWKPYTRPDYNPAQWAAVEAVARDMATVDNSDPFSYARTKHYLRQGYIALSETEKEARARLLIRRHVKAYLATDLPLAA